MNEGALVIRALNNAMAKEVARLPALRKAPWVVVRNTFGHGQTISRAICRRYGINPDVWPSVGFTRAVKQ